MNVTITRSLQHEGRKESVLKIYKVVSVSQLIYGIIDNGMESIKPGKVNTIIF